MEFTASDADKGVNLHPTNACTDDEMKLQTAAAPGHLIRNTYESNNSYISVSFHFKS